jgi:hypothetical protein
VPEPQIGSLTQNTREYQDTSHLEMAGVQDTQMDVDGDQYVDQSAMMRVEAEDLNEK